MRRDRNSRGFLHICKANFWILIIIPLISTVAGVVINHYFLTPMYQAKADLLINQPLEKSNSHVLSLEEIESNIKLIESYQIIIKSNRVMNKVSNKIEHQYGTAELTKKVMVERKGNSQIISIIVNDPDPEKAADIANAVAEIFKLEIKGLMNLDNVHILNYAYVDKYTESINPKPIFIGIVCFLIGLTASIGIILLKRYFNPKNNF